MDLWICGLVFIFLAACSETTVAPPPSKPSGFVDITSESGIDFDHVTGAEGDYLLPEIMGGGGGFFDFNGNGLLDVYLVQSGYPGKPDPTLANALYRNNGDGTFTDITDQARVGDTGYGMGCAAGDFNNNGFIDLYVTNLGTNVLYQNNGDGTFTDVTDRAGVGDPGWSTSAAFVDVDHDGWLDLFITNYIEWSDAPAFTQRHCHSTTGARDYCSPLAYNAPAFDTLYRNRLGDVQAASTQHSDLRTQNSELWFDDISILSNIRSKPGTGLGVVCSDLNLDGLIDVYVSNDQMPSFAWINQGDLTFRELAVPLGVAVDEAGKSQAGMGVDSADINNTGRPDIFKVHLHRETHILYINHGHYFDDGTTRWGLGATRPYTGFGAAIFDYDLDGMLDLFIANGRVMHSPGGEVSTGQQVNRSTSQQSELSTQNSSLRTQHPAFDIYAEPNQLLRQVSPGRFEDGTDRAGSAMELIENSRAAAFGDFDNDGDIDILIVNCGGRARLLRNDVERKGGFVTIRVLDENGRDAYGARLVANFGDIERAYEVKAAFSYCATNDPRVHIGLGEASQVDRIRIRWPDGTEETRGPFEANRFVEIRRER